MKPATKPQIAKINILINQLGFKDQKADIILEACGGRTDSSKALSIDEARLLLIRLSEYSPLEKLKSIILSLAYRCGIIYGDTKEDKRINVAKLNMFLKTRGTVKKELNQMSYNELLRTHRQFEAILKSVNNSSLKKEADKAVKNLLEEMNLLTA